MTTGANRNADDNSLFVTRHASCDRDATSESELPPASTRRTVTQHPISFGEIETTTCNATPVHHRANYAHWKATFRSSLRTWQSSGGHRIGPMLDRGEKPRDVSPTLLRIRFLRSNASPRMAHTSSRRPCPADASYWDSVSHVPLQYRRIGRLPDVTNSLSATTSVSFDEERHNVQCSKVHNRTEHAQLGGRLPELSGKLAELRRQRRAQKLDRQAAQKCMRD